MLEFKRIFNKRVEITVVLLVLIVFIGALLRFINLGTKSLWFDEAVIFDKIEFPLVEIFRDTSIGGTRTSEPLICYAISRFFYILTRNSSEFFLRLPSCLFGIGSIILIYLLVSILFNDKKSALLSSLLVTISQLQIWESQQLRPYSMTMFLSLVLLIFFFKFFKSHKSKDLIIFTFIAMLCSLVHYLVILLVAINILVIIRFIKDAITNKLTDWFFIKKWILSQLLVFSFCLIEYNLFIKSRIGFASSGYLSHWYFRDSNFFQNIYHFFFRTLPLFRSYLPVSYYFFGLVLLAFFMGVVHLWRKENGKNFIILSTASFVVTYILSCSGIYPYIFGKRTIFLSPFFYIIIGSAIGFKDLFKSKKINKLIIIVLFMPLVFSAFSYSKNYLISPFYPVYTGTPNPKFVINQFKERYENGDNIYIKLEGNILFKYYFDCTDINCFFGKAGGDSRELEKELGFFFKRRGIKWIYLAHMSKKRKGQILNFIAKKTGIDYIIADPPLFALLIKCRKE